MNLDLDKNLKVGCSCTYMNVSALYESFRKLYLAFSYTHCDFIYNKDLFIKFINPKPAKEYISPTNDLVIAGRVDSEYYDDCLNYINYFSDNILKLKFKKVCNISNLDFKFINSEFLLNDIPVLFPFDYYYLYDDYYKKQTPDLLLFHTTRHMAILVEIDFDNNRVFIVDKFYSFMGYVSITDFLKALNSDYLEIRDLYICENYIDLKSNNYINNLSFRNIFNQNIKLLNNTTYRTSSNNLYYKNVTATEMFRNDINYIIDVLEDKKGIYAPQFFSKLISQTILHRSAFYILVKYYKDYFINSNSLIKLTEESSSLWKRLDLFNDKTYLSGKTLSENKFKYIDLLDKILKNDTLLNLELNKSIIKN